jgi:hypothetical protein
LFPDRGANNFKVKYPSKISLRFLFGKSLIDESHFDSDTHNILPEELKTFWVRYPLPWPQTWKKQSWLSNPSRLVSFDESSSGACRFIDAILASFVEGPLFWKQPFFGQAVVTAYLLITFLDQCLHDVKPSL